MQCSAYLSCCSTERSAFPAQRSYRSKRAHSHSLALIGLFGSTIDRCCFQVNLLLKIKRWDFHGYKITTKRCPTLRGLYFQIKSVSLSLQLPCSHRSAKYAEPIVHGDVMAGGISVTRANFTCTNTQT